MIIVHMQNFKIQIPTRMCGLTSQVCFGPMILWLWASTQQLSRSISCLVSCLCKASQHMYILCSAFLGVLCFLAVWSSALGICDKPCVCGNTIKFLQVILVSLVWKSCIGAWFTISYLTPESLPRAFVRVSMLAKWWRCYSRFILTWSSLAVLSLFLHFLPPSN